MLRFRGAVGSWDVRLVDGFAGMTLGDLADGSGSRDAKQHTGCLTMHIFAQTDHLLPECMSVSNPLHCPVSLAGTSETMHSRSFQPYPGRCRCYLGLLRVWRGCPSAAEAPMAYGQDHVKGQLRASQRRPVKRSLFEAV